MRPQTGFCAVAGGDCSAAGSDDLGCGALFRAILGQAVHSGLLVVGFAVASHFAVWCVLEVVSFCERSKRPANLASKTCSGMRSSV